MLHPSSRRTGNVRKLIGPARPQSPPLSTREEFLSFVDSLPNPYPAGPYAGFPFLLVGVYTPLRNMESLLTTVLAPRKVAIIGPIHSILGPQVNHGDVRLHHCYAQRDLAQQAGYYPILGDNPIPDPSVVSCLRNACPPALNQPLAASTSSAQVRPLRAPYGTSSHLTLSRTMTLGRTAVAVHPTRLCVSSLLSLNALTHIFHCLARRASVHQTTPIALARASNHRRCFVALLNFAFCGLSPRSSLAQQ